MIRIVCSVALCVLLVTAGVWLGTVIDTRYQLPADADAAQDHSREESSQLIAQADKNGALVNRITRLEHRLKIMSRRLKALKDNPRISRRRVCNQRTAKSSRRLKVRVARLYPMQLKSYSMMSILRHVERLTKLFVMNSKISGQSGEHFRAARNEVRDEELLEGLSSQIDLDADERTQIYELLQNERKELGRVRREARRDFDIRRARTRSKELHTQTDSMVRDVLGEERFDRWLILRKAQRGAR